MAGRGTASDLALRDIALTLPAAASSSRRALAKHHYEILVPNRETIRAGYFIVMLREFSQTIVWVRVRAPVQSAENAAGNPGCRLQPVQKNEGAVGPQNPMTFAEHTAKD